MFVAEDVLNECLSTTISDFFDPTLNHPFLKINIICVSEEKRSIPHLWVDDVQIGDLFRDDEADPLALGLHEKWSPEDGREFLLSALKRLQLGENPVAHPTLDRMGRSELAGEKRRVKQELKRYDDQFQRLFARLPSHSEKEPMRPLYTYYRRLRTMVAQAEQSKNGCTGAAGVGSGPVTARFNARESLVSIPDTDEASRSVGNSKEEDCDDQIVQLEERIKSLQGEKSRTRNKLQSFQESFVRENNRMIRYHKDILPIEREYRQYKTCKEEILKTEQQLLDLRGECSPA